MYATIPDNPRLFLSNNDFLKLFYIICLLIFLLIPIITRNLLYVIHTNDNLVLTNCSIIENNQIIINTSVVKNFDDEMIYFNPLSKYKYPNKINDFECYFNPCYVGIHSSKLKCNNKNRVVYFHKKHMFTWFMLLTLLYSFYFICGIIMIYLYYKLKEYT